MNVNWANHIEAVSKIEPQQLIDYLEKHDWIEQHFFEIRNRPVKYYQKIVDGGLYQVTVPMSRELGDYNSAMLRAVVEISDSDETKRVQQITAKIVRNKEIKTS